jgi:hypothetical protein
LAAPANPLADPAKLAHMAKHSSHILDMARKGAEHKYEELKAEIASLVRNFPHLAGRRGGIGSRVESAAVKRGRASVAAVTSEATPKKRRKMSAKARKAISNAQKARWAKQKAATKNKA